MSKSSDPATSELPDLWTHEPGSFLEFKPGDSIADKCILIPAFP